MIGFYIYLMMVADSVKSVFGWLIFIFVVIISMSLTLLAAIVENKEIDENLKVEVNMLKKYIKNFFVLFFISMILFAITPTSKGVAAIIGGSVTYDILTSEAAKEIGGKGLELLNKQIDDMLKAE